MPAFGIRIEWEWLTLLYSSVKIVWIVKLLYLSVKHVVNSLAYFGLSCEIKKILLGAFNFFKMINYTLNIIHNRYYSATNRLSD